MAKLVIAIDGPSGSGKSSTSKCVALKLGARYLNTGYMYRALAKWCDDNGIHPDNASGVTDAASRLPMTITTDPQHEQVLLDGVDVTNELHSPHVSSIVSGYSNIRAARDILTDRMRRVIADTERIVVEGRDITTVVAPDADVRILLQADVQARMNRRSRQLGGQISDEDLREQIVERDASDSQSSQFEQAADGVWVIDSTLMDLDEVTQAVISLVPDALRSTS